MADDRPPGTGALAEYVEARYGDRLSEEEREDLRERIADLREKGDALSDVDLDNGDGPAAEFRAFRG